jgi:hypothetical protein
MKTQYEMVTEALSASDSVTELLCSLETALRDADEPDHIVADLVRNCRRLVKQAEDKAMDDFCAARPTD